MRIIKVLSFSTLFPNDAQPRHGIFLRHRLTHLSRVDGVQLRVVAPVPWFPSANPAFGRYSIYARVPLSVEEDGITVLHPRYPVIPKFGMMVAPLLMATALLPMLRTMQRTGFDFDVIDSYYLYPDGVAAALVGSLLRRPVLMTGFGSDVSLLPNYALVRAQILWAIRRSAAVTLVCEALKTRLIELGACASKIHVVLHGVDLKLFRPPIDRPTLRSKLGFGAPTLISVGNLIPLKGHDLAIEALAQLPGTELVIAGDGPQRDALRDLAAHVGVADRVQFVGLVDQKRLADLLGGADALVLCSEREGIANVLLEALACGTPVAATPVWGSPEVINTPEAGLLFEGRNVRAIVEGVRKLLANPPDRSATRRYAERFSWLETAARHAALIQSVANREPSRPADQLVRHT